MTVIDVVNWLVLGLAFAVFNIPIIVLALGLRVADRLSDALREKTVSGAVAGGPSYSRVTGALGAVLLTSFFWAIGNLILWKSRGPAQEIEDLIDSVMKFFAVGAALFLPYAFNQIRAMIRPSTAAPPEARSPETKPRLPAPRVVLPVGRRLPPTDDRP
jgi:hypothetical protein